MKQRIAVVGAGIAGVGAAWSLSRAGHEVDIFEANEQLGGNAKTHDWTIGGRTLTAGLAVLAWPEAYFKNYGRLLEELGLPTEPVRLRFFIQKGAEYYAHELGGPLAERYADDLVRWRRLVTWVRRMNERVSGGGAPSLYRVSYLNPLTYLPAWPLARAFGISRGFWDDIVVALYSSSFLTTRLAQLPAVILPTLDDLISVDGGGRMRSWSGHAGQVFEGMLRALRGAVHRATPITYVRGDEHGVELRDARGGTHRYDAAVLAGSATRISAALDARAHPRARRLLGKVRYVEATDPTFVEGHAHADASVLPAAHRARILADYCTFIDIVERPEGRRYENHFVVSSWAPIARASGATMLVYYGKPEARSLAGAVRTFSNRGGHPELSHGNLLVARRLRRLQGHGRLYYCGSYTTPGNGHDLSLLSGFVAASALGAPHPFAVDAGCAEDFRLLRRLMLG